MTISHKSYITEKQYNKSYEMSKSSAREKKEQRYEYKRSVMKATTATTTTKQKVRVIYNLHTLVAIVIDLTATARNM